MISSQTSAYKQMERPMRSILLRHIIADRPFPRKHAKSPLSAFLFLGTGLHEINPAPEIREEAHLVIVAGARETLL